MSLAFGNFTVAKTKQDRSGHPAFRLDLLETAQVDVSKKARNKYVFAAESVGEYDRWLSAFAGGKDDRAVVR